MKNFLWWVVLMGILAIPAFIFWNWWQSMSAMQQADNISRIERKLHTSFAFGPFSAPKEASGTSVLAGVRNATVSPVRARPNVGNTFAAAHALPTSSGATSKAVQPIFASNVQVSSGALSVSAQKTAFGTAALADVRDGAMKMEIKGARMGEALEFHPQTDRDPTLSPDEIARLKEPAILPATSKRRRAPRPIESRLQLMAIIDTSGSSRAAIVNDKRVGEGDVILGARILKITANAVVFQACTDGKPLNKCPSAKKKTFRKKM